MNDVCTYLIQLKGQVDEGEISATSPIQLTVKKGNVLKADPEQSECEGPFAQTLITICTDQSGLIGLLRHLHGRGFILLSMCRVDIA